MRAPGAKSRNVTLKGPIKSSKEFHHELCEMGGTPREEKAGSMSFPGSLGTGLARSSCQLHSIQSGSTLKDSWRGRGVLNSDFSSKAS